MKETRLREIKAVSSEGKFFHFYFLGWSGGVMVLGKLPVPGLPTNLD